MTVPTYDKCMLPLLQFAGDGNEHRIRDAIDALGQYFGLDENDRTEKLPSGQQFVFDNRVQWANSYLKKAGLLESVRRGVFRITALGIQVLKSNPTVIDRDYLMQFPGFIEFQSAGSRNHQPASEQQAKQLETNQTPEEILQSSYQKLRRQLAQDLLDQILACSPQFFERLVVDLLLAMGYGNPVGNAGFVVGRSGDGGIDGIINEDKLGFDVIYIQAKRWDSDNIVSRPTVQAFAGSLMGQGVTKGVLITTSRFSREAIDFVQTIKQLKIILIDGLTLADLMIDHNIGVSPVETYVIKKVDIDFFETD